MTRVKGGPYGFRRHRKVLKYTKGQRGTRHFLFKRANEAMLKSMWYAYRDRRVRKREFRRLWVTRVNAACRACGMRYSELIAGLHNAKVELDRKSLSEVAIHDPDTFAKIVELAKKHVKK